MASFLNAGAKTATAQRSVQISVGEDNSFIFSTAQQTRQNNETLTPSQFHAASLKMQQTTYVLLELHNLHNNLLANYMEKYTMPSILAYELAVRQMVHDSPPGTTFQSAYLELGNLHLVTILDFTNRQQLLSLQSAGTQQRSHSAYAQQNSLPSNRMTSAPQQQCQSTSFPPCHNFATGECNNIRNGKCTRDHACAACGKSYPTLRCCPQGHKGEAVCAGITELIAQRLNSFSKRPFTGAAGGSDKRPRTDN